MHVDGWGLYPWCEEHGRHLVHPEDYDALKVLMPYGRVFQCVGNENDYLVLRYGTRVYRVLPELFLPVPPPAKGFGEPVRLKHHDGLVSAVVTEIMWHFKDNRPFYFVSVDKKKSDKKKSDKKKLSKRYWEEDFIEL